jgi:hypothetical protein
MTGRYPEPDMSFEEAREYESHRSFEVIMHGIL